MQGVDPAEADKFRAMAEGWWDPRGPMAPLHRLNPARLVWLRDRICAHFGRDATAVRPFAGLRLLDVGCGGGLLAEPMARLGATVTAIDPVAEVIDAARWHAEAGGLAIDYRALPVDGLDEAPFDVVLALELVEHVPEPHSLVGQVADMLAPGGLALLSTLSRTFRSWATAIVGAEYVARWLPVGTHDWRRFVDPPELSAMLREAGLRPVAISGLVYDTASGGFVPSRDTRVNYLMAAVADRA